MSEKRWKRAERRGEGRLRALVVACAIATLVAVATPAVADEYDSTNAAHPLRIAAYVLHPVGVILDYLIVRPAHWLVSNEPLKTLFGHED